MSDAATFDVNAGEALEPPQLSPDEIVAERQRGRKAGYFAVASAVLMIASLVVLGLTLNGQDVGDTAKKLLALDQRPVGWISLNMLAAISTAALAPLLVHIAIAERRRRPTVPNIVQILALVGPIMVAVALPLQQVFQLRIAKDFAESDVQTVKAATAALKDTGFQIAASIGLAGTVALGFAIVMISYYAIGTGLFTRFIGVVGILIGFMNVLPILGAAGILQVFWLTAVAVMLLGPAERQPPAWAAGRTVPWPKFGQRPDESDGA
jgi:MFS family permease